MNLASCYGAIAELRDWDIELSTPTFLTLVNTAQLDAPAPKRVVDGAGFWDRRDITDWASAIGKHTPFDDNTLVEIERDDNGALLTEHVDEIVLLTEWVEEDSRRAGYPLVNDPEHLVPQGVDFSDGWRGVDRVLRPQSRRRGIGGVVPSTAAPEWNLRLNTTTNELFFWAPSPNFATQVLPVGSVPDTLSEIALREWFGRLERFRRDRNSMGLIFKERALHDRLGWTAIPDPF